MARIGAAEDDRVLVATDCLSEGINLQEHFDAVVHYDLSWNPTRHEQREGRVDRFGQPSRTVRATLLYGINNPVDGAVLDVILRKAARIREELGVPVPVPDEGHSLTQALLKAVLLRRRGRSAIDEGRQLELFESHWEDVKAKAKKSRTVFAQQRIKPDDVLPEWRKSLAALGGRDDVQRFAGRALARLGSGLEPLDGDSRSRRHRCRATCASVWRPKTWRVRSPLTSRILPPRDAVPCSAATLSSRCSPRRCSGGRSRSTTATTSCPGTHRCWARRLLDLGGRARPRHRRAAAAAPPASVEAAGAADGRGGDRPGLDRPAGGGADRPDPMRWICSRSRPPTILHGTFESGRLPAPSPRFPSARRTSRPSRPRARAPCSPTTRASAKPAGRPGAPACRLFRART